MTTSHRTEPHPKKFVTVNGRRMAYVELGEGDPVFLFLHGNPTSSYLWRNVMPQVADHGRCVAPDLIGMGDSEKLENPGPDTYGFATHREFLWGFIESAIGPDSPLVKSDNFIFRQKECENLKAFENREASRPNAWEELRCQVPLKTMR